MRRSTFSMLFYIKKSQPKKNGTCPVMGRITIDGYVSAEKVKNAYLGLDNRCETLLKVFARNNEDFERMYQAGSRSWRTLYKYQRVYALLSEFIKFWYNRTDIALKEIQRNPFFEYSIKPEVADRGYLTKDEIKTLIEFPFEDDELSLTRDLFIFCCYTNLSQ